MFRQLFVAMTLAAVTSSVHATYFGDHDHDEIQEYVIRERHWNDWDNGETYEYRYRERQPWVWDRGWSRSRHAHREYREYCPPPRKIHRGRAIERIESPRFDIRFEYRGR